MIAKLNLVNEGKSNEGLVLSENHPMSAVDLAHPYLADDLLNRAALWNRD